MMVRKLNDIEMECGIRSRTFLRMNLNFKGCESILRKKKWKMSMNHATGSQFGDWIEFCSSLPIFGSYGNDCPWQLSSSVELSPPPWSVPVSVLSTLPENGHKHIEHSSLSLSFTHAHPFVPTCLNQNVRRNCAVNNFLSVSSPLSTLTHCHLPSNNPQTAMLRLWVINSYYFERRKFNKQPIRKLSHPDLKCGGPHFIKWTAK